MYVCVTLDKHCVEFNMR